MLLLNNQPQSLLFPNDLFVWRPVFYQADGLASLDTVNFSKADRGALMAKISLLPTSFIWEPEAISPILNERPVRGITIFVDGEEPKNWTYLRVTGVSKALQDSSKNGGAVFASFGSDFDVESYLRFRSQMFRLVKSNMNVSLLVRKQLVEKMNDLPIIGKRLILSLEHEGDDHFFNYVILE